MATHLVIGDPHCTPKASNERFLWAGRVAADYKVSHVICMGDFCSMDSLSTYDRGKKSFEGRRYRNCICVIIIITNCCDLDICYASSCTIHF